MKIKGILTAILLVAACLTAVPACERALPEGVTATEGAVGWRGQTVLTGSRRCGGVDYQQVQGDVQSFTRPIQGSGAVNYYTITLKDLGGWATDYVNNRVQVVCSSMKVPVSPACTADGAICSDYAICSVFVRWHGRSQWELSGTVQSPGLQYRPDASPLGSYTLPVSQVLPGSGDGTGIAGCPTDSNGRVLITFGG